MGLGFSLSFHRLICYFERVGSVSLMEHKDVRRASLFCLDLGLVTIRQQKSSPRSTGYC
jgi:hypothetical protein